MKLKTVKEEARDDPIGVARAARQGLNPSPYYLFPSVICDAYSFYYLCVGMYYVTINKNGIM
jgi:hypothetical protein